MDGLDPDSYRYLRGTAERIWARGGQPSLSPTALLHEAWEKLARAAGEYTSRAHFMATAALAMRQILVDQARARNAQRRQGNAPHTTLSGVIAEAAEPVDVLALDSALAALERADALAARTLLLRVFGGLTVPECAEALGLSPRSVKRKWVFATAFVSQRLR